MILKGQIRAISRHMEGQESYESDSRQGTVQQFWIMHTSQCTRLYREYPRMYAVIGEKAPYIIFLMFLGMVNDTLKDIKWSIGNNESAAG